MDKLVKNIIGLVLTLISLSSFSAVPLTPAQATKIAKEAYIYAFPLIENYKAMYLTTINKKNSQYKAPFNVITNLGLATPKDTAVVTPNSDTPYSMLWADLRTEPLVLSVPPIANDRYYSLQFIDLYTYDFAYIGSRTTGNKGGKYLLAGPHWHGDTPKGIEKVIHSDTDFVFVIYRTQLFNPQDMDNVKKIQAQYQVESLSKFLDIPAPTPAPKINFPALNASKMISPEYFGYLNFLLQFAPTVPEDKKIRAEFTKIGITPGKSYDIKKLTAELQKAISVGMQDGINELNAAAKEVTSSANLFGTRASMKNNYLNRALGAKWGLYGNVRQEATYINYNKDVDGAPLSAEKHQHYIIHFGKDELPPVNAFWSVTMYDGKTQLLVANPLNRYLINSPMLPNLHIDEDGGLSIYIQYDKPIKGKAANWLPAPNGPFYMVLRLYWPKESVLNGTWIPPVVRKI